MAAGQGLLERSKGPPPEDHVARRANHHGRRIDRAQPTSSRSPYQSGMLVQGPIATPAFWFCRFSVATASSPTPGATRPQGACVRSRYRLLP